jgi:hypothetical protein
MGRERERRMNSTRPCEFGRQCSAHGGHGDDYRNEKNETRKELGKSFAERKRVNEMKRRGKESMQ